MSISSPTKRKKIISHRFLPSSDFLGSPKSHKGTIRLNRNKRCFPRSDIEGINTLPLLSPQENTKLNPRLPIAREKKKGEKRKASRELTSKHILLVKTSFHHINPIGRCGGIKMEGLTDRHFPQHAQSYSHNIHWLGLFKFSSKLP